MSKQQIAYLVVRVDGSIRVAKKPRIGADEIAIRLHLVFPDNWGKVISDLTVEIPDFTPEVKYEQDTLEL